MLLEAHRTQAPGTPRHARGTHPRPAQRQDSAAGALETAGPHIPRQGGGSRRARCRSTLSLLPPSPFPSQSPAFPSSIFFPFPLHRTRSDAACQVLMACAWRPRFILSGSPVCFVRWPRFLLTDGLVLFCPISSICSKGDIALFFRSIITGAATDALRTALGPTAERPPPR
eukprot:scaffold8117_cov103-Isochrysis_galbana.AAC.1